MDAAAPRLQQRRKHQRGTRVWLLGTVASKRYPTVDGPSDTSGLRRQLFAKPC